jgi:hypothetical protein
MFAQHSKELLYTFGNMHTVGSEIMNMCYLTDIYVPKIFGVKVCSINGCYNFHPLMQQIIQKQKVLKVCCINGCV